MGLWGVSKDSEKVVMVTDVSIVHQRTASGMWEIVANGGTRLGIYPSQWDAKKVLSKCVVAIEQGDHVFEVPD